MMNQIGKFLAGVCALIFVLTGVIAIVLFSIEQKAFSAETYKAAFKEQGVYETAPSLFVDIIISSTEYPDGISPVTSLLSRENLTFVISSLLPPDEMEQVLNEVFESFFVFLNGDSESISIPLFPFKQYAASGAAAQALTEIIRVQPECTADQLWQMSMNLLSPNPMLILCNPPEHLTNLVLPFFQTQFVVITSNLPDELTVTGNSQPGLLEFRTRLTRLRAAMRIVPVIPVIFLLGIAIFGVRSLKDWMMWWGIPFLITGITSTLLAVIGTPLIRFFVDNVILQGNANMPTIFLDMMRNVTGSIVGQILWPIAISGIALALIGAGMLVSVRILSKKLQSQ